MKLYLIRHGQTDWNIAGKIQGNTDIPLNDTGIWQAGCLAKGMERRPVSRIFSSPLSRAVATANAIGEAQHICVQQIDGLEEVGFGVWEGLTLEEIQERYPKEYQRWCLSPVEAAPQGGERQQEIRERCSRAIETILAQAEGDLAIVSHGATLVYIMEYLMREHPLEEDVIVHNSSITTVEYDPLTGEFVLLQMNDISHLE